MALWPMIKKEGISMRPSRPPARGAKPSYMSGRSSSPPPKPGQSSYRSSSHNRSPAIPTVARNSLCPEQNVELRNGGRSCSCHFMQRFGLISVSRVLRGMKVPKVTGMKGVPGLCLLFRCGSGKFLGNNGI